MPEQTRTDHGEAGVPPVKGEIVNPQTKHETSDVNVKALLGFVVVFIVFAIVTHIVLYLMFNHYRTIFRGHTNEPLTAIERPAGADVPVEPRLQPFASKDAKGEAIPPTGATPVVDMETMRHDEDEALNNPGWIDQKAGRVRLPIEVAKQLVVQRGLPVVNDTTGANATAGGTAVSSPTPNAPPQATFAFGSPDTPGPVPPAAVTRNPHQ
jgi:hypothetical protein